MKKILQNEIVDVALRKYQWNSRLLLIFSPTPEHQSLLKQKKLLSTNESEMKERDLIVFNLFRDGGHSANNSLDFQMVRRLRGQYCCSDDAFAVILIGKDGTVKRRENRVVRPELLFSQIDSMPMRQSEIFQD